jgi:hypothetical protein
MEWETIASDPEFKALPFDKKKNVAKGWFAETVSSDPEFQAMPVERRDWTYSNFLKDSGLLKPIADPAKAIIQQQIGGKVPEGYKYNELGELEPVEAVAKQKGYVEALHEPTAKPTGIGDYVTRVIPESIQKTAYGLARMPYDAVKGVTDPLVQGFQRAVSGEQDTPENVGQTFMDIGKNAAGFVTGMSEFMGKPIGLYGLDELFDSLPDDIHKINISTINTRTPITFRIPDTISRFTNLDRLTFDGCITSVPDAICELKKLAYFAVLNCPEVKSIPACVATLPEIMIMNIMCSNNISVCFVFMHARIVCSHVAGLFDVVSVR